MDATETPMRLALARLSKADATTFKLTPDTSALKRLAAELDLLELRKVKLEGMLTPDGQQDWRLDATVGATVVQPCSVTLAPVTTRIDRAVSRRYLATYQAPAETEAEMPEDDTIEAVPEFVDLMDLLVEELTLALPDFPRAEGVELGEAVFTEPGVAPLTDESAKPFAGLAALKKSLDP